MAKNIIQLKDFLELTKEEQVNEFLSLSDDEDKESFLKSLKKQKPMIHMKLLSAIKSKENIDSSIKKHKETDENTENIPTNKIKLENIEPNPFQPRKEFNQESLEELASSIAEEGLLQDIVVTPNPDKVGHFILIAGERRWRAYKINKSLYPDDLKYIEITAKILENIEDIDFKKKSAIENISREDMNLMEIADSLLSLKESGMKLTEIKKSTGKSISYISRMTIIASLDEKVKVRAIELQIKSSHMLEYIAQKIENDVSFQIELLEKISEGMKIAKLKEVVDTYLGEDKSDRIGELKKLKEEYPDNLSITKDQFKQIQTVYKKLSNDKRETADNILSEISKLQKELISLV
ncbi:MAG: ParB/RepB/Spo0J family partition protein [Arcobacteraceae bacterium]